MTEYRIKEVVNKYQVWSGYISDSCLMIEEMVFEGRLADALAWIEVKRQNLFM